MCSTIPQLHYFLNIECRVIYLFNKYVGVTYAGPLIVGDNDSKPTELFKAYILVFNCASTLCTHLELVTDLQQ